MKLQGPSNNGIEQTNGGPHMMAPFAAHPERSADMRLTSLAARMRPAMCASIAAVVLGCGDAPVRDQPRASEQPPASQGPLAEEAKVDLPEGNVSCPSFESLGKRVDQNVDAIRPGVTLQDFTASGSVSLALNFWNEVGDGLRETVFFVYAEDGNAVVSDNVVCRFDGDDRLISCRRECCRSRSRSVSLEQYNLLELGDRRTAVEARLCSPSLTETKSNSVHTYYHIPLPVGHHDEGQTVKLVFEDDVLTFKDMNPYY